MLRAFQKLVDRHRDRVFTFACYCLGDRDEAEDVTQEVLVRLWGHFEHLEAERIGPWLIHVTRNACIDAIRKRNTYRALVSVDPDGEMMARAASDGPDPVAMVESADFQQQLERALERIAEPYRSIVILREIQDLKYEEISEALDIPLNTIKVYLHRGRRKLREHLKDYVKHGTA